MTAGRNPGTPFISVNIGDWNEQRDADFYKSGCMVQHLHVV